jgi:hypothetical protein
LFERERGWPHRVQSLEVEQHPLGASSFELPSPRNAVVVAGVDGNDAPAAFGETALQFAEVPFRHV